MAAQPPIVQQPTNTSDASSPPMVQQPDMEEGHGQPQYQTPSQPVGPIPGVPIGLEILIPLDHIIVKRQNPTYGVTLTPHQYDVFDSQGQRIFLALETSDPRSSSQSCGISRDFTVDMMDSSGRKILNMRHQTSAFCDGDAMTISLGDETFLGEIQHHVSCGEKFDMKNAHGEPVIHIMQSPACCEGGCCHCESNLLKITLNDEQIGLIRTTFSTGCMQKLDNFGVEFLRPLDVTTKALLFAAVFLMDFLNAEYQTTAAIS